MANAKFVEGEKKYTGGTGIEVTPNKVINLLLRAENNLIKVDENNDVYTDLQLGNDLSWEDDFNNIPVGVTTGRVSENNGWYKTGTLLAYKTTSGDVSMWLYGNDDNLYFYSITDNEWKHVMYEQQVLDAIDVLRKEISKVGFSNDYNDLDNLPTIGNATLNIQKNGADLNQFTANATEDVNINIEVPTQVSELANDAEYITKEVDNLTNYTKSVDFVPVAKTNDYNDLDNKPTIGNGELFIQKNGTVIDSFHANDTGNTVVNVEVPTSTSEIANDSGYITNQVSDLQNYTPSSDINASLATKVDKSTTYEMTNLAVAEDGTMSETFTIADLPGTLDTVEKALDRLYLRKANKNVTDALEVNKADITYVNELVGSSLGVQTTVVDALPAVGSSSYIYLVETAEGSGIYTKYVWDTSARDYVDLGTTAVDMSNYVTLDGDQQITGVKTYTAEPVLPANANSAQNINTKSARESQVYAVAQSVSKLETDVSNTYATVQALEEGLDNVSGDIGAGILTIQKNGANVATFGANQKTNQTANITVPTNTNELTNGAGFITKTVTDLTNYTPTSGLSKVALSNSYADLDNKPTIPTVGNGTLTIQKNGTNVATFTANQSGNATANIQLSKTDVGLGNVDNTSDVNKPVSTAQAEAIAGAVSAFAETVDEELASKQATLVSGTNIKTINSTSLLGSGNIAVQPTLVSGTNIKTINGTSLLGSGNIQAGNTTHSIITVTLTASGWTDSEQTVTATGVTASNGVLVSPAPDSIADYATAMIYCTTQASNKLTFSCSTVPENDITVNVMIIS